MPLFNKKFENKPIPPRSARCNRNCPQINEELDDYKHIALSLGNKELRFVDGIWIHATRKGDADEVIQLNRSLKSLEEQHNMSELKIEVLLDLLAEQMSASQSMKLSRK